MSTALEELPETERRYDRIIRYVGETAWAIHPASLQTILAIISERRSGHRPTTTEVRARVATAGREHRAVSIAAPGVAVVPITGVLVPRGESMEEDSGSRSIEGCQKMLRQALTDPEIAAIVLDVDSPGGSVDLVSEFGAEIFAANQIKPIIAVANTWAASAAYWIATAASELVVSPSGEVGSIGVYSAHTDISGAQAQMGIVTTLISAGDYKTEGNPFEPLTDEGRAYHQAKVDAYYEQFLSAVATHRDVSSTVVRETFGKGRMVMAADAVARGMADRVGTISEVIARLADRMVAPIHSVTVGIEFPKGAEARSDLSVRGRREGQEFRHVAEVEVREAGGGQLTVVGYAALFEEPYPVEDMFGEFMETVHAGAFAKTITEADVRYFYNHAGMVFARTKNGTLKLAEDSRGLHFEAELDPESSAAKDLARALRRGDVDQSSFSFKAITDRWSPDYRNRELFEVKLFDVSSVAFPAAEGTTSGLRMGQLLEAIRSASPEQVAAELRDGDVLPAANAMLVSDAIATLSRLLETPGETPSAPEPETPETPDPEPSRDTSATLDLDVALRDLALKRRRSR